MLSRVQQMQFQQEGFLIVRRVFLPSEIDEIRDTFMEVHASGPVPGYFEPSRDATNTTDPLKQYPRVLYPHRFNPVAKKYMLDHRLERILRDLLGEEPLAAQSMFYYKPPGARGQALHQDNYYLRVEPGTCVAAWVAVDEADEENGGLVVVPKTSHLDIQCPHEANSCLSFYRDEVDLPSGSTIIHTKLGPGDVLFFNGSTIHGSYPNRSSQRFRRSFICHYVGFETTQRVGLHINEDLYNFRGVVIQRAGNLDAGPCGTEFAGGPH